ncbi:exonuclease domain-containing protein [Lacticaseibacillus hegangensis]|uniref:Exonuclease domain-containing protein n=1 Tax=Lacticaseibacillus hegangensis TaxID=2486010 RepID=A0ABW4CXT0_9LACO|nr:exonuclease domain-containing protein [Lacticaseibacillus hegangensis]
MKSKSGLGCVGSLILVVVIMLVIKYWAFLVLGSSVILIYLLLYKHAVSSKKKIYTPNSPTAVPKDPDESHNSENQLQEVSISQTTAKADAAPIVHKLRRKLYDYIVFDIETTGLRPADDEIIQLSALKVKNDKITDTFDCYIHPNAPIPEKIVYLTGISNDTVANAPGIETAMQQFSAFAANLPLVGHNIIRFDVPFIISNGFYRTDIEALDTWRLARTKTFPEELPNLKLPTLKDYFGIESVSHNAIADCKTNMIVYQHLRDDSLARVDRPKLETSHELDGLRFAITGQFIQASRDDIAAFIVQHGGRVTSSVSRKTDYLVDGQQISDSLTDGLHSAKELSAISLQSTGEKIKTIGYDDLIALAKSA